jgi:mannose-6-phosphate isomerase-like protein (cupin superfamily)
VIKRITPSDKDQATLTTLLEGRRVVHSEQPADYRGRVVLKPWGHEYLIFQNEHVAIWALHIKHGHSTSMHCHPFKKTCLIVLSGNALCNTFYRRNYINGHGAVIIENGVFHSTHALSENGIHLIEVESPPNKLDLVRLNDTYGRENSGYESESAMQTDRLDRFHYFHVEECTSDRDVCRNPSYSLTTRMFSSEADFRDSFQPREDEYYISCRGRIEHSDGNVLVDVGEVQTGTHLRSVGRDNMRANGPLFLLAFRTQ